MVAQALCLSFFNLSPTQKTCLLTDGNKANVSVCISMRERDPACGREQCVCVPVPVLARARRAWMCARAGRGSTRSDSERPRVGARERGTSERAVASAGRRAGLSHILFWRASRRCQTKNWMAPRLAVLALSDRRLEAGFGAYCYYFVYCIVIYNSVIILKQIA